MATTTKRFKPSFLYTYRNGVYANSVSPVRSAGSQAFHSVIGFPQSAIDAIRESKTPAKIRIRWRVTDAGVVAFGAHKKASDDRQPNIFYSYIGIERSVPVGWYTQEVTDANIVGQGVTFKNGLLTRGFRGLMFYGTSSQNYMQGYGITSDSNSMEILIEGTFDDVPTMPSNLVPSNGQTINSLSSNTFSWRHNGSGEASQPHQYRIAYKLQSSSTWTYFPDSLNWATSTLTQHTFPAGTFTNGQWVWQVKTRARNNQESPWSAQVVFNVANILNAPPITSPTEGQIVNTDMLYVAWNANNQRSYTLFLYDSANNLVYQENETTTRNNTTLAGVLVTGESYQIILSVTDNNGNNSASSTRNFTTNFVRPKQPVINSVVTTDGTDHIVTYETFPIDEAGLQAMTISHANLYVRVEGEDEEFWLYERNNSVSAGSTMYFYLFGSGVNVDYMIEAVSTIGTSSYSDIYSFASSFEYAYLSVADASADQVTLMINDQRDEEFDIDTEVMKFLGRRFPVPEFGIGETTDIRINCILDDKIDVDKLKRFKRVRKKLYYRDSYGRSMYCVISSSLKIKDRNIQGYDIQFTLSRVDGGI